MLALIVAVPRPSVIAETIVLHLPLTVVATHAPSHSVDCLQVREMFLQVTVHNVSWE